MTASTQSEAPASSSSSSSSSSSTTMVASSGLILSNTEPIRSFLTSSSTSGLTEDLRQSALSLSSQPSIPYQSLRSIWVAADPSTRPPLSILLRGSSFLFTSPKPREKSEELKARLKKLEEIAERKAYAELVKDITPKEANEPFSSYKDQLGFGIHVVVTMFTCYLVGYIAFRALFDRNPVLSAAGGIVGLIIGMFVETLLFIIRTSDHEERISKSSRSSIPSSQSNLRIKKNL